MQHREMLNVGSNRSNYLAYNAHTVTEILNWKW